MNINRVCFAGNHTAEPAVNHSPKGTAVVSASMWGALATLRASLQVSIMCILDHYDHDRYYHEDQYDGNNHPLRPPVDGRAFLNKRL